MDKKNNLGIRSLKFVHKKKLNQYGNKWKKNGDTSTPVRDNFP